ncbi:MAG: ABC transporter substrate-binding protein [Betaproteobacteria bacterium]|nr:ABC transporter substrate-binding protein [Betaproteobacteria bacterium]
MNSRRKLLVALGAGVLAAPLASFAQQARELLRVGYLGQLYFDMFQRHMRELGYVDGSNILIERRDEEGQRDRIPVLVRELVQQKVRVLVVPTNVAIEAAREATATIPIVMVASIDPVAAGYVATLARPGRNITGVANLLRDLSAKRIEMLREMFPRLSRLAILWDEEGPGPQIAFKNYETAAQALKVRFQSLAIRGPKPELEGAFRAANAGGAEVIIVVANPMMFAHRATVMALSRKHRLPLIGETAIYVDNGALASYGPSLSEISQRIAVYVDKILRGEKPADLPVEQPTKFDLTLNMKTAKALGIKIPQSILVQAGKVIE